MYLPDTSQFPYQEIVIKTAEAMDIDPGSIVNLAYNFRTRKLKCGLDG